ATMRRRYIGRSRTGSQTLVKNFDATLQRRSHEEPVVRHRKLTAAKLRKLFTQPQEKLSEADRQWLRLHLKCGRTNSVPALTERLDGCRALADILSRTDYPSRYSSDEDRPRTTLSTPVVAVQSQPWLRESRAYPQHHSVCLQTDTQQP